MAISTSSLARVSTSLRTFTLLSHLNANSTRIFREEQRLASGQRLLSISDDPIAAEKIARMSKSLETQDQILRNLKHADAQLAATDGAIGDISGLLIDAARVASEQAGTLASAEERAAQAVIVEGIIDQLMTLGNRQFRDQYLFAGRGIATAPFSNTLGRVTYVGDPGATETLVATNLTKPFNLTADALFGLRSSLAGGHVQFDVQLTSGARLADLDGALDAGLRFSPIRVTEVGPNTTFDVDFAGAATVADLIARFDAAAAAAGSSLTMSINGNGLRITSGLGNSIQVQDIGNGQMAADLGIRTTSSSPLNGASLNRRVTATTAINDLASGGLALPNGVVISNGNRTATVTFAGITKVDELLNRLNGSGVGIRAFINDAGDAIVIENQLAGTDLVIGENGGNDAERLGIKTIHTSTTVASVNGGRGLHPVTGNDIRITDANSISFEVDLSNAVKIGDVIDAINAAATAAGSSIVAQTGPGGGGLRLTGGAGPGSITVAAVNLSPVAQELGILKTGSATVLDGDGIVTFRQTGVFSALYRLRDALRNDNTTEITLAGGALNAVQQSAASIHGEVGARSRAMRERLEQTEDAVTATSVLLSELKDVDFAEAVTRFQQAQTALQATLLTGSRTLSLSLLNYLQ